MNSPTLPPALRATAAVARPLLAAASGLVGIAALAYLIGWKETSPYYSAFGAPWVTSLLSPSRLAQSSAWVIWITLIFAFTSIYSIATFNTTHHGMRKWGIITLSVGLAIGAFDAFKPEWLSMQVKALLLSLAAVLFAVSAGLTIAEVIARFKEDGFRWHSYYLWLFYFVVMLTFHWAPARMGEARARLNMLSETTSLPAVRVKDPANTQEWRLLEVLEGHAVLVVLGKSRDLNEFRVIPLSELQSVRSTRKPPA